MYDDGHVGINVPESAGEEERVSALEGRVAAGQSLPLEAQKELRQMLASEDQVLRDRIIRLLNPWGADIVDFPEDRLKEWYSIVQENSYWKLPSRGSDTIMFDACRGYYVLPVVKPLR